MHIKSLLISIPKGVPREKLDLWYCLVFISSTGAHKYHHNALLAMDHTYDIYTSLPQKGKHLVQDNRWEHLRFISIYAQNFTFDKDHGILICNQYYGTFIEPQYHINSAMRDWNIYFLKILHFYLLYNHINKVGENTKIKSM